MKLEDQVCSLDLAKKLKELGVKQESLCYWLIPDSGFKRLVLAEARLTDGTEGYSAFTVAELGEMLADRFRSDKRDKQWWGSTEEMLKPEIAYTEADARATMLTYLVEYDLLEVVA